MQTGLSYAIPELEKRMARSTQNPVSPAWRRRRLRLGRWRRLTRWEYWSIWAIYPPVVVYILWLGLRHRGWTLFTAVNPGMPAGGGVVGLSKSMILNGLARAGNRIATWTLVESGALPVRNATVRRFMAENGLGYPVVLKPDRGERGAGVVIARDVHAIEQMLRTCAGPIVVQAYVPGVEWGVFYVRKPGVEKGEIFAITDKRVVGVEGDGVRSLEALILADDRAVNMAPFFLGKFTGRLSEVLGAGERLVLSELGTHCLGAVFLDGDAQQTPQLADAVDAVSQTYEGFYFGRYDLRAESAAAMQAGEFRVIELNGVTSEATSMYDPKHSVWYGWATLCRQWKLAFEIGAANRRRGATTLTFGALLRLVRTHGSDVKTEAN
jgi:hypothetical protein